MRKGVLQELGARFLGILDFTNKFDRLLVTDDIPKLEK